MRCPKELFKAGNSFHFFNHAIGKEKLFIKDEDYQLLLRRFEKFLTRYNVSVFAYCLMPTHFHFLLRQEDDNPAYELLNSLFSSLCANIQQEDSPQRQASQISVESRTRGQ